MAIVAISWGIPIVRPTLDSSVSMSHRRAKRQNISFETDRNPSRLRICIWTEIEIEGGFDLIFDWTGAGTCFFERFLILSIKSVSISTHANCPVQPFSHHSMFLCFSRHLYFLSGAEKIDKPIIWNRSPLFANSTIHIASQLIPLKFSSVSPHQSRPANRC